MAFRRPKPYEHKEAFCLMLYRDSAGNEEWIWNSRDGVTPFCIESKHGLEAQHVEWSRDRFVPDHKPKAGDRVFVDLTIEKAREYRTRFVEQFWDKGMHEHYPSREEAIEILAQADLGHGGGGAPDIVEWTDA